MEQSGAGALLLGVTTARSIWWGALRIAFAVRTHRRAALLESRGA